MVVALTMATQKTAPSQEVCTLQHPSPPVPASQRSLIHSGLEVALEARASAPVPLEVSCTHPTAATGNISSSSPLLQRAIENWGQTWERGFSISSIHSNLLGPSTRSLWRVLERINDLNWSFGCYSQHCPLPLPHSEEGGSDHALSPRGGDFRLLWRSWCWGSCHLLPLLPQSCHSCCPGWGSWQMSARQPEVIKSHCTYKPEFIS